MITEGSHIARMQFSDQSGLRRFVDSLADSGFVLVGWERTGGSVSGRIDCPGYAEDDRNRWVHVNETVTIALHPDALGHGNPIDAVQLLEMMTEYASDAGGRQYGDILVN